MREVIKSGPEETQPGVLEELSGQKSALNYFECCRKGAKAREPKKKGKCNLGGRSWSLS